ncbi:galactose metabolism- protein, partial [Cryomyces antarcticus]
MGNNPSSSKAPGGSHGSQSQSPAGTPLPHSQNSNVPTRREPKRRGSLQTVATGKATPAPPSASLETAVRGSHSTSASQTRQTPTKRAVATPQLRPLDSIEKTDMGSEQSSQKARPSRATRPVGIPPPSSAGARRPFSPSPIDPSAPPPEQYHLPPSQYSRPPRLPLPIDEEFHKPGSPITSAADDAFETDAVDIPDLDGPLPRRSSVLSATTLDEDEVDELDIADDQLGPTAPTVIEWKGPGSSVFVSGTFAGVGGWSRKLRLHKKWVASLFIYREDFESQVLHLFHAAMQ